MEKAEQWIFVLLGILLFAAVVYILVQIVNWCATDAQRRGKSGFLVFVAVFFFFPWGLIAWLIFRPNPIGTRQAVLRNGRHRLE